MVDEMRERLSRQGNAERSGMSEVRERLPPGRVILAEDQLTVRSLGRTPLGDASLQRAQMPVTEAVWMPATQLLQ